MGVKQIASRLSAVPGIRLEDIAKSVSASDQEEFDRAYAREIVRKRLDGSGLRYSAFDDDFPFVVDDLGGAVVGVAPRLILPKTGRGYLENHARKMRRVLGDRDGFVYFLPFQFNGRVVRANLERFVKVDFVDLPYSARDLDRRFYQYHVRPMSGACE